LDRRIRDHGRSSIMLPMASRPRKKLSSALALPDEAGELYRARVRIAEALPVVVEAAADHLHGFDAVVHFGNADGAGGLAGHLLVGEEVMPQPLDQPLRGVGDVAQASVGQIVLEYRHDLVVCFVAVDHAQPSDGPRAEEEVGMRHRLLGEDADVHRIAVAADVAAPAAIRAALPDPGAAIRLRDEPVECRGLARVTLRAIDAQVPALLVQLVFHRIGRDDLDVRLDHPGRISRRHAMPGVRLEHGPDQFFQLVGHHRAPITPTMRGKQTPRWPARSRPKDAPHGKTRSTTTPVAGRERSRSSRQSRWQPRGTCRLPTARALLNPAWRSPRIRISPTSTPPAETWWR